ncbi:hypothetical protein QBC39DRAFT_253094 [Podospora conica]|nr:hypothetical protein QBC39DRAFT_253094 [Schizothecium conicum]
MRIPAPRSFLALLSILAAVILPAHAQEKVLRSNSLAACQANSMFTASLFDVVFTPNNNTVAINIQAISSIEGYVLFDISIRAYGYEITRQTVDPCDAGLPGLCPMTSGEMNNPFNLDVGPGAVDMIPGIAYSFPDLDAKVKVFVNMTSGSQQGHSVACVEAMISNGKTVDLIGLKWGTAIVAGLALVSSAIVAGLGYSNAASHVAASALALFSYFQAQAMIGLCGVPLPPIVQAWTQNLQWSMGIIKVDFIQTILTWYQRATGGTASFIFDTLHTVSVQVQKRSLPLVPPTREMLHRAALEAPALAKRQNIQTSYGAYVVYGIQRVAFRAGIETTNLFLTGLTFFWLFLMLTLLAVVAFKGICELAGRRGFLKGEAFEDFRRGWRSILKGIVFRVLLLGFPQIVIFGIWELTQKDSDAAMVLAIVFFFGLLITLLWAAYKVISVARRSVALHRNAAYILFSDQRALNKWGFLYVQFRATAYYFIVPVLLYLLVKGMFIALAQASGTIQAVAFLVLDSAALITASVMRPYMDKSTNSFAIAICAVNFANAIFLFIFTDVLGLPPMVIGVVGVILWILNAAFSLILLVTLIITTGIVLFHNNPDARYHAVNDDRNSFMKSQNNLHTHGQLDALAATARNSGRGFKPVEFDEEVSPVSSASNMPRPSSLHSAKNSMRSSMRQINADPSYGVDAREPGHMRSRSSNLRSSSPYNSNPNLAGSHVSQHNVGAAVGYKNPATAA